MGERKVPQEAPFYSFSLKAHVPERHLMRLIDRIVDLCVMRAILVPG